jgi:hypothetical protein
VGEIFLMTSNERSCALKETLDIPEFSFSKISSPGSFKAESVGLDQMI